MTARDVVWGLAEQCDSASSDWPTTVTAGVVVVAICALTAFIVWMSR